MTKSIALSLVLAASLGLAACSGGAENAANASANAAENASNAADNAMNAAMNAADNASNAASNAAAGRERVGSRRCRERYVIPTGELSGRGRAGNGAAFFFGMKEFP